MKTRTGFVSNSSSSSFLTVGTEDEEIIRKIIEPFVETREFDGDYTYMAYDFDSLERFGCGSWISPKNRKIIFFGNGSDVFVIGLIGCKKKFKYQRYQWICNEFQERIRKAYNIDISYDEVDIIIGKEGNE